MGNPTIPLLILLLISSTFLLLEARPLGSSPTEGNLITVSRKGRSSTARSGLKRGVSKAPSWSTPARAVPVLIPGSTIPNTSANVSKEPKSGAAKFGFSFFFFSLITIALFF